MGKPKKQAKVATRGKAGYQDHNVGEAKLIMVTNSGHLILNNGSGRAKCGVLMDGWRYAPKEAVSCANCTAENSE